MIIDTKRTSLAAAYVVVTLLLFGVMAVSSARAEWNGKAGQWGDRDSRALEKLVKVQEDSLKQIERLTRALENRCK